MALPTKKPHSRRKPGSIYPATEPLKHGSRLSPGMRFFLRCCSRTERGPFAPASRREKPQNFCRALHRELEAVIGGDNFDLVAVAADLLVADRLAGHPFDLGVVIGGLVVKQHLPPDLGQLRQLDADDVAGVSPILLGISKACV